MAMLANEKLIPSNRMTMQCMIAKTIFDYMCTTVLIIVFAIPLMFVALIIKIDSPGPVVFKQPRIGFKNRVFLIYKFRTMYDSNDQRNVDGSLQATRNDERITRVGKWLRKFSIDETPQLLNVIRREMSLVGPRPHPINMNIGGQPLQEVVPEYWNRHCVLPGITGWAQVNGLRGETITLEQIKQRVAHDLHYIHHWSLAFDIQIIALTIVREILSEIAF